VPHSSPENRHPIRLHPSTPDTILPLCCIRKAQRPPFEYGYPGGALFSQQASLEYQSAKRLVVHHRERSNAPASLVTLCIRCHTRIHCSSGVRHWLSGRLLRLWRELHLRDPVQLQLLFRNTAKKDSVEPASLAIISLFPSPSGIITEVAKDWLL
jgi:hypothetical protein